MQEIVVASGHARGAPVPWWFKIAAKLILKRVPVPHTLLSKLNLFRHSYSSGDPDLQVRTTKERVASFQARTRRTPGSVLELGPGEITTCVVVYKALGIDRSILVDVGDFGVTDVDAYRRVAAAAAEHGLTPPDLRGATDRAEIFARCGAQYHVDGLAGLLRVPTGSVDFVSSIAVIEHVRLRELAETFHQLRRIMKDDGVAFHAIDFQDHLGGKLANLRFPPAVWESEWMARSGFYTNRVSASRLLAVIEAAGFELEIESRSLWPEPPTTRNRIARELQSTWTDTDLRVCSMSVVVRPT